MCGEAARPGERVGRASRHNSSCTCDPIVRAELLDGIRLPRCSPTSRCQRGSGVLHRKARYSADKFKHIEGAMVSGPLSRECGFSLADIVLAQALRYFDAVD